MKQLNVTVNDQIYNVNYSVEVKQEDILGSEVKADVAYYDVEAEGISPFNFTIINCKSKLMRTRYGGVRMFTDEIVKKIGDAIQDDSNLAN